MVEVRVLAAGFAMPQIRTNFFYVIILLKSNYFELNIKKCFNYK